MLFHFAHDEINNSSKMICKYVFCCLGVSLPAANATRWSSTFRQLSAVAQLSSSDLGDLLRDSGHKNLVFTLTELSSLKEIVEILEPFAEVTELLQGEKYATIGCVVPSVMALKHFLENKCTHFRFHTAIVRAL